MTLKVGFYNLNVFGKIL